MPKQSALLFPTTPRIAAPNVPMIVPEINPEHAEIIKAQRKRLGTKRGFHRSEINCSLKVMFRHSIL